MTEQKRILVVDDDQIIRDSLCEFLRLEGHLCQGAPSFSSALNELEKQRYHLVLTDVNMPEIDGEQLSQFIRNQSTQQSVPVLMVTSETDEGRLAGIARSGVSAVFDKPFTVETLRNTIERIL